MNILREINNWLSEAIYFFIGIVTLIISGTGRGIPIILTYLILLLFNPISLFLEFIAFIAYLLLR